MIVSSNCKRHQILSRKKQLYKIIKNKDGSPDYLAINIYYDFLRPWYMPSKRPNANRTVTLINGLNTQGVYMDYNKLVDEYHRSKETIRRKIVKLEKLGLILKSYQDKDLVTHKTYNKLIIYVLKDTPHFFNPHGIDIDEIIHLKPQTNHQYIKDKFGVDYDSKIQAARNVKIGIRDTTCNKTK